METKEIWKSVQRELGLVDDGVPGNKTALGVASVLGIEIDELTADGADGRRLGDSVDGRHINPAGIRLVKEFEGLFLGAYLCPAGVWTIGYGHTGLEHNDGTVYKGRLITAAEAEELLLHDLTKFAEGVEGLLEVPVNDNQFAALVSFAFNVGLGNLRKSTLLRKLNAGDTDGAAAEFRRWNKAAGKTLRGLTRRREAERDLFES